MNIYYIYIIEEIYKKNELFLNNILEYIFKNMNHNYFK